MAASTSMLPQINVVLDGLEPYRKTFSAGEWKLMIRSAFTAGCQAWLEQYLPLRFTNYARAKLAYRLQSGHIRRKQHFGAPEPLVWTGETQESVLSRAAVKVGGSAQKPYGRIPMRLPGPRAEVVVSVLSTILDSEMGLVARTIEQEAQRMLAQATVTERRKTGTNKGAVSRRTFAGAASRLDRGDRARSQVQRQHNRRDGTPNAAGRAGQHQGSTRFRAAVQHAQNRRRSGPAVR